MFKKWIILLSTFFVFCGAAFAAPDDAITASIGTMQDGFAESFYAVGVFITGIVVVGVLSQLFLRWLRKRINDNPYSRDK